MVDNPVRKPAEPTRVERAATRVEDILRVILAGSTVGAVRRIVLYIIVAGALVAVAPGAVAILGMVAVLLLLATDRLV